MKRFLILYRNRRGDIFEQKTWAKNQAHAIKKLRLEFFDILAITKLDKKYIKEIEKL